LFNASCGCDDKKKEDDNPYMDRDYNYVACILAPDSFRNYRSEVFVGEFLDQFLHPNEVDTAFYGEDTVLYDVNLSSWHYYRGKLVGKTGATVYITGSDGNKILFEDIGHGYYRDVSRQLRVRQLQRFNLEVQCNGNKYTASTVVPGDFIITNLQDGDLKELQMTLNTSSYYYWGVFPINWILSEKAMIYRLERWDSLYAWLGTKLYHDFNIQTWHEGLTVDTTKGVPFDVVDRGTFKVVSIDSCWGPFYAPERSFSAPEPFMDWYKNQTVTPIKERSNIQGPNVVGVFGSYNQTKRITFYMKGVR
jgi:hypothetical protein